MPGYIDALSASLAQRFPQPDPLWNLSTDNTLPPDWLFATPVAVWGKPYPEFKQPVAGDSNLHLQACTTASGPTQQCEPVQASVTMPGATPQRLLVGHSYQVVDAMYRTMVSAEVCLDITTLSPPRGMFLDAIRNAIAFIAGKPQDKRPVIRILYSNPLPNWAWAPVTALPFLQSITGQLDPSVRMEIYVSVMSSSFSSWNHAKIVAADGTRALVGGHNMWGSDYLGKNPVHDVSMTLAGSAARHAQDYANNLWNYDLWRANHLLRFIPRQLAGYEKELHAAYRPDAATGRCVVTPNTYPAATLYDTVTARFPAPPAQPGVKVLAIGRGGNTRSSYLLPTLYSYAFPFDEPSDGALVQLVSLATTSIRMSVQSFRLAYGAVAGWNGPLFAALGAALKRGVSLQVVMSNPGAIAGGQTRLEAPYDGESPSTVMEKLLSTMTSTLQIPPDTAREVLAARARVASFRYSADGTYPEGMPIGNHAKTLIVDDKVFYIGSQNMYASNLNEFGFVVEDDAAARDYVAKYWEPLWRWSAATVDPAYDADFEVLQQYEAVQFVLALDQDTRMKVVWDHLLAQRTEAPDPQRRSAVEKAMDELVVNGGFVTTALKVLEARTAPFFTEDPGSTQPNAESLRFVVNVMTLPDLMRAFAKIVDQPAQTPAEANAAIDAFLRSRGYACTALQVMASFVQVRRKVLPYWAGSYSGWVTADGGASFSLNATQPARSARGLTAAAADDAPLPDIGPDLVIGADGTITLDGTTLAGASYDNNGLSWPLQGNPAAGALRLGIVTRATLSDDFQGSECFGTLTYGDGGARPRGVYSFYARLVQPADSKTDPGTTGNTARTVGYVLGAIVLAAMLAALARFAWNRRQYQQRQEEIGRDKRARETEEIELERLVKVSSPGRTVESDLLAADGVRRRIVGQERSLEELARYESAMRSAQRIQLQDSASSLQEARTALRDDAPGRIGEVVRAQRTTLTGIDAVIDRLADSLSAKLTIGSSRLIEENTRLGESIDASIDRFYEQREEGLPFEEELE